MTADIEGVATMIENLNLGLGQAMIFDLQLLLGPGAGRIAHLTGEHITAQGEVFFPTRTSSMS